MSCLLKSCVSFWGAWFPGVCVLIAVLLAFFYSIATPWQKLEWRYSRAKARMARQIFYTEISCLLKSCILAGGGGAWFPGVCVLIAVLLAFFYGAHVHRQPG